MKTVKVLEWVEALESGEHKQTTGVLTDISADGVAHCCLGLLCHVGGAKAINPRDYNYLTYLFPLGGTQIARDDVMLSGVTADDLAAAAVNWSDEEGAFQSELAERNDAGATFAEIAGVIRTYCDLDATIRIYDGSEEI